MPQPRQFPPEVLEALAAGSPIEAIKRLRRAGLGLAEAKAALEAYRDSLVRAPSGGAPQHAAHTFEDAGRVLPADVIDTLQRGDTIGAIRLLRQRTGIGLQEAKQRIDAARPLSHDTRVDSAATSWTTTEHRPTLELHGLGRGEVPRSNAALWLVLALLAVLVAYLAL
jgi:ribosomal protein L7/L12